jgi:signal peptidase II
MKHFFTKGRIALWVIVAILIADQIIKVLVKTNMYYHDSIRITDWFYILFTENNGMAFGLEIFGKLVLSLFRIAAVAVIGWYLTKIIKMGMKSGYIVCVSLILTGALGNIIDSVFYGVLFNESTYSQVASFLPESGGYAPFFYGKVVDMFYFPLIETNWPEWVPFVGGEHFVFFSPIFNLADASISCGMIALILFYSKCLNESYLTLKQQYGKGEQGKQGDETTNSQAQPPHEESSEKH